jgi:hypothetical protein
LHKKALSMLLVISVIIGVFFLIRFSSQLLGFFSSIQMGRANNCTPPADGFSEKDIVGIWEAGVPEQNDKLAIREDGTYKQIIHVELSELPDIDYESDWMSWWVEIGMDGIPYLHLEGFRYCGFNPDVDCNETFGGGFDFCKNIGFVTENEGILLVLGTRDNSHSDENIVPPRGISIWLPAGSENTWVYYYDTNPTSLGG